MNAWSILINVAVGCSGVLIFLGAAARTVQHGQQRLVTLEDKLRRLLERRRQALENGVELQSAGDSGTDESGDATRAA